MIAYRIKLNGELILTAGQDDWSLLATHITASRDNLRGVGDYIKLSIGGLSKPFDHGHSEHYRWAGRDLSIGDKIEVEIVDVDAVDLPVKRYRSDTEKQESPYTEEEWREMRYRDYLELKKEFGND